MSVHPLRKAYMDHILDVYGVKLFGDKNPARTERFAQQITRLGISVAVYVELAVGIWHGWATQVRGWSYPYWNLVTSDKTLERVEKLIALTGLMVMGDERDGDFAHELAFATDFIYWYIGHQDKPHRVRAVDADIRIKVAEYLCGIHGIPFVTSNYLTIAQEIENLECG